MNIRTEEMTLLNCGRKRGRGDGLGICCGKNNDPLEEDFSKDLPIAYPVHAQEPVASTASSVGGPKDNTRWGLKALLAVLCVSLLLGVVVALLFSSSSASNSSSGSVATSTAGPAHPSRPPTLEFYMYRAQADASYPPENLNTADLAAVLWYLHNEVVVEAPRMYRIDRIKRWKITMRTTQEYWNVHHRSFGPFIAFNGGGCEGDCGSPSDLAPDTSFQQYGFLVGCQQAAASQSGYRARVQTRDCNAEGEGSDCQSNAPIWYSLPGECPTRPEDDTDSSEGKDSACRAAMPGGRCDQDPTGAPDCTYRMEDAGEIFLNELAGFEDQEAYDTWWQNNTGHENWNNVEYLLNRPDGTLYDRGVNWTWWDQKFDEDRCNERMARAERLFAERYPHFGELQEPPCDFDRWYQDEFTRPINHTLSVAPTRGFQWAD
jgi:hypothetical protein